MIQPTDFLSRQEAAHFLGVAPATLEVWASQRKGPPFYKPGRYARYRVTDLEKWLESRRVTFDN